MIDVLMVDDDSDLGALLTEYLYEEGFSVRHVTDGRNVVAILSETNPQIVVLDIMMPGVNGIEILRRIRRESAVPVLMLTARGDEIDRIAGLDLGADDYVTKPCSPGELAARLRAILRRAGDRDEQRQKETLRVGGLVIDPVARRATWNGSELKLTGAEFNLLETLVSNAGRVVDRKELCETGLGRPLARFERAIDVHMSAIRQKLGPLADGRSPIVNVRGAGYQFVSA